MTGLNKREVLYDILAECGYSDWFVVRPSKLNPKSTDTKCILFNFKESRKAETDIPIGWFNDPRRYHAIGELMTLAIDNSSCSVPQSAVRKFFIFTDGS